MSPAMGTVGAVAGAVMGAVMGAEAGTHGVFDSIEFCSCPLVGCLVVSDGSHAVLDNDHLRAKGSA